MSQKALFLDRDGVINEERGYVHRIEDFQFIDGVFAACREAARRGYLLVVITNQAGIARGYFSVDTFRELDSWMRAQFESQGVPLAATYYCPYHPLHGIGEFKKDAECRKPRPGMILDACSDWGIDPAASILVGDKLSDVEAGRRAGIGVNILVRSGHELPGGKLDADLVFDSIAGVGEWLKAEG